MNQNDMLLLIVYAHKSIYVICLFVSGRYIHNFCICIQMMIIYELLKILNYFYLNFLYLKIFVSWVLRPQLFSGTVGVTLQVFIIWQLLVRGWQICQNVSHHLSRRLVEVPPCS